MHLLYMISDKLGEMATLVFMRALSQKRLFAGDEN